MAQQAIRAWRDDQGRPWVPSSFSLNSSRTRAVAGDKVAPSLSRSVSDPVAQAEYDRISEAIWLGSRDSSPEKPASAEQHTPTEPTSDRFRTHGGFISKMRVSARFESRRPDHTKT